MSSLINFTLAFSVELDLNGNHTIKIKYLLINIDFNNRQSIISVSC